MKIINRLNYIFLSILIFGVILTKLEVPGHNVLMALGFFAILVLMLIVSVKYLKKGSKNYLVALFCFLLANLSIVLFLKYLHWSFFDYYSLIITGCFVAGIVAWVINRIRRKKLLKVESGIYTISIVYCILLLFVFFETSKGPNVLVHRSVYDKLYDVEEHDHRVQVKFQFEETRKMAGNAEWFIANNKLAIGLEAYQRAVNMEPRNASLRYYFAQALMNTNDLDFIILQLDTVILYSPDFTDAYNNRGVMKYKLAKNKEAIEDFNKGISIDSTNPMCYFNRALAQRALGMQVESCQSVLT